ncbi:MAG: alpha/beta hydrolase [Bacteroidetes bacterium]|nr:alpha/beta hydrolase [Bacteroidota bacterium]
MPFQWKQNNNWSLSLMLVLSTIFSGCLTFKLSDKRTEKKVQNQDIKFSVERYVTGENTLRYFHSQKDRKKETALLFIHGAPGSSKHYLEYMINEALLKKADVFAVDRLGYGESDWGKAQTSIYRQCLALEPLIDKLSQNYQEVIIIGHSYGGSVAAGIALMYPDKITKLLLLAPALNPNLEEIFWFSWLGKVRPTRWLTPKALRVATDEKFNHARALEVLWEKLNNHSFHGQTIHIHGNADKTVHYENTLFSKIIFPQVEIVAIEGANHYIPWQYEKEVLNTLDSMLEMDY